MQGAQTRNGLRGPMPKSFQVKDYGNTALQRYPDPAYFLPDPLDHQIFMHTFSDFHDRLGGRERIETYVERPTKSSGEEAPRIAQLRAELVGKISTHLGIDGVQDTDVPGLSLYRQSTPTACASATYDPRLIVFVQGQKRINLGRIVYLCDESTFLLSSIDLPVVSQVIQATAEKPMLGLLLKLEMPEVRRILSEEEFSFAGEPSDALGMAVGKASLELLGAFSRLVDLLEVPADISFLSGLIQREIIYRLLRSPQGKHLRAIATLGEQSHRTAKAVSWLRTNYAKPLRVEELAAMAQMGVSTLHHHFRSLTAMSPLQYQKQLRLHVARERMLTEGLDAASAAFEVGYESASQFNREYSRFFGQPPMRDVKALRFASDAAVHD
jgi:AraC-like DNA-binding protein